MAVKESRKGRILLFNYVVLLSLLSQANSQILWNRIFPTDAGPVPQDCFKQWGKCQFTGEPPSASGAYYREEEVIVPALNGGNCVINRERYCNAQCTRSPPCNVGPTRDCRKEWSECYDLGSYTYRIEVELTPPQNGGTCELRYEIGCNVVTTDPVDCVKRWGRCIGSGPNSFRDEEVVAEAQNGGACNIRREYGCNQPVDCRKRWGRCVGSGPTSRRTEEVVTPARNGGSCVLNTETNCNPYKPIDCRKRWGNCVGFGPTSQRTEEVVSPARHGGKCVLRTERGCNKNVPVDCVKEWGECIGSGPTSFRDEIVVTPAKHGGACDIRREFGCNIPEPVDCTKKWGECVGNGPKSVRKEEEVTPARHGGKCRLREEKGCRRDPVDCVKKWGECIGIGEDSYREEEVVTKQKYGGRCQLRRQKGCNTPPQDCVKRWGQCVGVGPGSFRDEIVVTEEKYGGTCDLRRELGCRSANDCIKTWGQCIGKGETSSRKEVVKTKEKFGGKPCTDFKTEMGCNKPQKSPEEEEEESNGKKLAGILVANFWSEGTDSDDGGQSGSTAGARSLGGFKPNLDQDEVVNQNCSELLDSKGNIIALGCDGANDIEESVKAEVRVLKRRTGVKRPEDQNRRKRSTDVAKPKPETPRDVLFYLDSSGSVGPYKFSILKEVCKAIIDALCGRISLGKWQTRVSMATFNARQLLSFPFTTTSSTVAVKKQIDQVGFDYVYSFQSCIKDALKYVLDGIYLEVNGARDPSYAEGDMFMMTDGCANCDFTGDTKELQRQAYRLKLNKVNVYAIGVGIDRNCREILKVLARGGRCFHFYFLDNWDHDVEDFLSALKNPPDNRCLDRFEHPGINCLDRP